jgi:parallel beta-helix repeat protein
MGRRISMKVRILFRSCICLLILTVFFPTLRAAASFQLHVTGGSLVVNDYTDADARDGFLSLREAMNVANGVTGPYSSQERGQMTGCTFNAGGMITGGCGAGGDTIQFAPSLTQIVLTSNLPQILKDEVTINGAVNAGNIIINANAVVQYGFQVNANQVSLTNLTVINPGPFGNAIRLVNNSWMGLQIYNNYLGVLPRSTSCNGAAGITSRPYYTILLLGGSGMDSPGLGTAYIDNNVIGCALNDGIANQDAPYVYIGQNISGGSAGNWIGVSRTGANIGNGGGISVCCSSSTTGTQILGNRVGYNFIYGINLTEVPWATVSNNDTFNNTQAGIYLYDSSFVTLNNNISHGNGSSGIWLEQANSSAFLNHNNHILGGAYYQNGGSGISESSFASGNTWSQISTYNNMGLGIDKKDNGVPDLPSLTIDSITPAVQGVMVNGTLTGSIFVGNTYHIELYRIEADPTGNGEGRYYLGSADVTWNLAGNFHWSIPNPSGMGCYTAIVTDSDLASSTSSEFSANLGSQCNQVYLPSVVR